MIELLVIVMVVMMMVVTVMVIDVHRCVMVMMKVVM
jgi:hypothetical protein